ncbi:hypothetical protein [Streptomyces sp. AC555_RSS877]|uniref:hypothetical protein n=1 Tax=Streptomyces sp. AC555_RSS877 TaxID=2823688 RepID=UPI001C259675|nr:hypothetical protein [Streptomyces sp. AC555_RSS877]
MTDLIHRLITWVTLLLKPPSAPTRTERPPLPTPITAPLLPPHRSPYGLDTPLDATTNRSVRPYLAAHELWFHGLEFPGLEAA